MALGVCHRLGATDPGGTNELGCFKVICILVRPLPEATE